MGTLRDSIVRIVRDAFPEIFFSVPRTYTVAAYNSDGTLDLVPPPDARYLPELQRVEQWTLGGARVHTEGDSVLVLFRDANQARPVAVSFAASTTPSELDLAPSGSDTITSPGDEIGRIPRYGDPVVLPVVAGATPTVCKLVAFVATPGAPPTPAAPPVNVSKVRG
jgi:hypothetical protein